jgi:hypothetical protein
VFHDENIARDRWSRQLSGDRGDAQLARFETRATLANEQAAESGGFGRTSGAGCRTKPPGPIKREAKR